MFAFDKSREARGEARRGEAACLCFGTRAVQYPIGDIKVIISQVPTRLHPAGQAILRSGARELPSDRIPLTRSAFYKERITRSSHSATQDGLCRIRTQAQLPSLAVALWMAEGPSRPIRSPRWQFNSGVFINWFFISRFSRCGWADRERDGERRGECDVYVFIRLLYGA